MSVSSGRKITQILGAELDKLVTLPLIWLTLIGTFILNLVLAAAFTSVGLQGVAGTQSILNIGLASMGYLQAGFIILGILATCSEYTGGQIRTTLTTIPWRGFQLSTKHLALAIITIPVAFIIVASGVLYALIMMRDTAVGFEIDTMIKTLVGATGYLTLTTLLSAAIGALLRRTTPALVILLGYYFVVSPLTRDFQPKYFPDTAGSYMYMPPSSDEINVLTPMQGTGILMLWTLIFITAAIVFYRKRDA
ncbi:ABC transporter permease [Aneurinibacillus aneurinilyticus]|uniref:ABC transporter permease n=1 Tax=Aneurinibacillus aneurinilyticus TaxID=1391 RepID=A0A848D4R3_ANEAE|nr:ABC transporter permease [Aneurinibacillus aneurinilyticus]NMF01058.1 ABC transporter permease [Aneurinibacillus aneurinilyticus]